ncbi:MAG: dephospho-CoA kinase [Sinomicrobium sp.]|nr:dephospho-CoA kinase [Sinomicrobium sp.]
MIVGLTGGIGSGKSTVAALFEALGVPVYTADAEARRLMASSPEIRAAIIANFGEQSYHDHDPDSAFLAAIVFKDKEKLRQLNNIIHPRVQEHFSAWYKRQKAPYVIKEAAILFESGAYKACDKIITVTAPVADRIQRVMKRDNASEAMVNARMSNQWTDEKKAALSDFVIENTDMSETVKEVKKIHDILIGNSIEG